MTCLCLVFCEKSRQQFRWFTNLTHGKSARIILNTWKITFYLQKFIYTKCVSKVDLYSIYLHWNENSSGELEIGNYDLFQMDGMKHIWLIYLMLYAICHIIKHTGKIKIWKIGWNYNWMLTPIYEAKNSWYFAPLVIVEIMLIFMECMIRSWYYWHNFCCCQIGMRMYCVCLAYILIHISHSRQYILLELSMFAI